MKDESGYTLRELAILLLIVGVAIGGVLGVQQVLTRGKVIAVATAIDTYRTAVATYIATYGDPPGDDRGAQARWGETVPQAGGIGDGKVQGIYNANAPDQETRLFWGQLRAAGLITGTPGDTTQPKNPFGGVYGVQEDALGMQGLALCFSNVAGSVARTLLARLDDAERDLGRLRAIQLNGLTPTLIGTPSPGPVPGLDDDLTYVVCAKL
jgi:hypothetical protein